MRANGSRQNTTTGKVFAEIFKIISKTILLSGGGVISLRPLSGKGVAEREGRKQGKRFFGEEVVRG